MALLQLQYLHQCALLIFAHNSVGHSIILAHAHAVKIYREQFKPTQKGLIGITLNGDWAIPWDNSPENIDAAQHALDFAIGT